VYGTDGGVWRPERWLKKDLRETEKMVDHLVPVRQSRSLSAAVVPHAMFETKTA
ncbi:hypothetical protein LTR28_010020, partial [Elasticomyces elasticus]